MNERYARRFEFGKTPGRATIEVSSLPGGAHIEYTGVAVRDLQQRKAVRPKKCHPARQPVPASLRATLCIARPRVASSLGRTAALYRHHRHRPGRPCAIFWIISKKLEWISVR